MQEQASEFAAFIGIDWADRKHDVCLQIPGASDREASVLEHSPRVIDAWARQLRERFGGRPIAVCLELAQGPIVSALLEYEFFVIFPVNPSTLATYRRAFVPSGAKDDPTDAALALELLRCHPEKLAPLRRESDDMRALRRLVEARRDLVQDRVRVTNRLTFTLKDYFPQNRRLVPGQGDGGLRCVPGALAFAASGPARAPRYHCCVLPRAQRATRHRHRTTNQRYPDRASADDRPSSHPTLARRRRDAASTASRSIRRHRPPRR